MRYVSLAQESAQERTFLYFTEMERRKSTPGAMSVQDNGVTRVVVGVRVRGFGEKSKHPSKISFRVVWLQASLSNICM